MLEHDDNRELNAWLHTIDEVQPSAHLQRSIAEIPLRHPRAAEASAWWPFSSVWKTVAAAVVAGALGVIAGSAELDGATLDIASDTSVTSTDSELVDDGLALAFAVALDEEMTP